MFDWLLDEEGALDKRDADQELYRLREIQPGEVSLVDRAANKRRFLVVKRSEVMGDSTLKEAFPQKQELAIPAPVKAGAMRILQEANARLLALVNVVQTATESESEPPIPPGLQAEINMVAQLVRSLGERYPSPVSAAATKQEMPVLAMPGPVKASVLAILTEANERLLSVLTTVQGATETQDESAAPLPTDLVAESAAISQLLAAVGEKYPTPVAASAPVPDKAEVDKAEIEKAGRKMAGHRLQKLRDALSLLTKILQEVELQTRQEEEQASAAAIKPAPAAKMGGEPTPQAVPFEQGPMAESLLKIFDQQALMAKALADLASAVRTAPVAKREPPTTQTPNSLPVEPKGKALPDEPDDRWPMDLNAPVIKKEIPQDTNFWG